MTEEEASAAYSTPRMTPSLPESQTKMTPAHNQKEEVFTAKNAKLHDISLEQTVSKPLNPKLEKFIYLLPTIICLIMATMFSVFAMNYMGFCKTMFNDLDTASEFYLDTKNYIVPIANLLGFFATSMGVYFYIPWYADYHKFN